MSFALAIFLFFIYLKYLFPFLGRISDLISNSYVRNFFIFIQIVLMLFTSILPYFIVEYFPKTKEQINNQKFDLYRYRAIEYKKNGDYISAYQYFDSAEYHAADSLKFHTEKSQMKHFGGDSKSALDIINVLIKSNEKKNVFKWFDYECRSMYYFRLNDYENAIADIHTAMKIDSSLNDDLRLQLSLIYLLSNNLDSSLYYLNMAIWEGNNNDSYEFKKESNLLNALIHYKMENLNAACVYFKAYNEYKNVGIYPNYIPEFIAQRDLNGTSLYQYLFKIDIELLTNSCK